MAPIIGPAQRQAAIHHGARQVEASSCLAPSRSASPLASPHRIAVERLACDQHMALGARSHRPPDEANKMVSRSFRGSVRTGLPVSARPVHFARRNSGQPNAWSFGAPQWTIPIPDPDRRATESCAPRHDRDIVFKVPLASGPNVTVRNAGIPCQRYRLASDFRFARTQDGHGEIGPDHTADYRTGEDEGAGPSHALDLSRTSAGSNAFSHALKAREVDGAIVKTTVAGMADSVSGQLHRR